jgi:hypothetical protein
MKYRRLNPINSEGIYALAFDKKDDVIHELLEFATKLELRGAEITGIGAFSDVVLGYFEPNRKQYHEIPIGEQVEVLSLTGNISTEDANPKLHLHVVVGRSDGTAYGGHLLQAHVWPTLEIVVTESPKYLQRRYDPDTGLALLDLAA